MAETLFYVLAAGAVAFGAGVVAARMPLFSVLSLLGAFFCLAGIYLLLGFQFLAATQLLVYAGAIIALSGPKLAIASGAAGLLALIGVFVAPRGSFAAWTDPNPEIATATTTAIDDVGRIAEVLFSKYMLPFEAASLLLLATMIGVVALAKRQRPGRGAHRERAGWPWERGVEQ